MTEPDRIRELEEKIRLLETRIRHLTNDLRLTREENELAMANYLELYENMEEKVQERTQDVRELKRALEQKGQELELMLDSSPAIIFYKDREQLLLRVNRNFARMAGVPVAEIIGRKFDEIISIEDKTAWSKDQGVLDSGRPLLNEIETLKTPKGTKQMRIDRIPYTDMDNRPIGIIGFALDVTELKEVEEERTRLEAQLLHAQRMESIGTLAGGIAHNFNNLLMGILGHISLMVLEADEDSPQLDHLKKVEHQIRVGADLTKQLLGYARKGQYNMQAFNLNHLVKETASTFGIAKKDITLHYDLAAGLLPIQADEAQLEQVLMNLYINASDAMPRGGDIFIETRNASDTTMTGGPYHPKPGEYVSVSIRDSGEGMDPETMERIFEPFFTTKGLAKGTGLGLASAYGIVKGHGGYINVSSEKGQGATFTLFMPAAGNLEKKPVETPTKTVRGRGTVLVVDDEETVLDVAEQMLRHLGYDVITAQSGHDALIVCERHRDRILLVLLDMVMPGTSGGETFDRLRDLAPGVPILLSSGYSLEGEASDIMARGCQGFIQKPFNLNELSERIRDVLRTE
jgi:PAS domain S-box-containing protein